jgi:hypothetical protein
MVNFGKLDEQGNSILYHFVPDNLGPTFNLNKWDKINLND